VPAFEAYDRVRDGHHRISVARALGEGYIDAEVMQWEIEPLADWEAGGKLRDAGRGWGWRRRARAGEPSWGE
jgi:hypothetical protein